MSGCCCYGSNSNDYWSYDYWILSWNSNCGCYCCATNLNASWIPEFPMSCCYYGSKKSNCLTSYGNLNCGSNSNASCSNDWNLSDSMSCATTIPNYWTMNGWTNCDYCSNATNLNVSWKLNCYCLNDLSLNGCSNCENLNYDYSKLSWSLNYGYWTNDWMNYASCLSDYC